MDAKKFNNLLKQIKQRNSEALTELFNFYFPKISRHIAIKFNNEQLGDDVAQLFFIDLHTKENKADIENPTSWVYTVCSHIAINELNKLRREVSVATDTIQNLQNNIDKNHEEEFYEEYAERLNKLDELTRKIVTMHVYDKYTYKEIAEILGENFHAVRQKCLRALKKLKKM